MRSHDRVLPRIRNSFNNSLASLDLCQKFYRPTHTQTLSIFPKEPFEQLFPAQWNIEPHLHLAVPAHPSPIHELQVRRDNLDVSRSWGISEKKPNLSGMSEMWARPTYPESSKLTRPRKGGCNSYSLPDVIHDQATFFRGRYVLTFLIPCNL